MTESKSIFKKIGEWMVKFYKDHRRITGVVAASVAIAVFFNLIDVFLMVLAATAFITSMIHIVRKVLYPYYDMKTFMERAWESPIGAAVVVASIMVFNTVLGLAVIIKLF